MRCWLHSLILSFLFASSALAQVQSGDARLFMDTDVFSYERTTIESVGKKEIDSQFNLGPGASATDGTLPGYVGLGLGYVFHPRLIGSLHFSYGRHQEIRELSEKGALQPHVRDPDVGSLMMRPELEIPLNPKNRIMFAALVGFDLRYVRVQKSSGAADQHVKRSLVGYGPVAGIVTHLFLVKHASLDVGAIAAIDFIDTRGDDANANAVNYRNVSLSVQLGFSLWP
jgi:hypothetical protein